MMSLQERAKESTFFSHTRLIVIAAILIILLSVLLLFFLQGSGPCF
jgi:hypothetical protein